MANLPRFVVPALLASTPSIALAHSVPTVLIYIVFGVYPLLLCLLILCIYLPFSRFSRHQSWQLLGRFILVALVVSVITYLVPNEVGYFFSFLNWVIPLLVVPARARRMRVES